MNTWSGQPEESAWHWTPENCQKLGHVIQLLKSGTAEKREQVYQEFIEIKRWFIEEEFNEYLDHLENFQTSMGGVPLRETIAEIQGQRKPVTGWMPKPGKAVEPVMLPEMIVEIDNVKVNINSPSGEYVVNVNPMLDTAIAELSSKATKMFKLTTRYDLFIQILKGGYHALEK